MDALKVVPMDRVRAQFETNVFGLVRLTQLVLPGMRRQRWGKVVNLSSMGGRLTFPGGGFYHATKYAVEAISDALRFEVRSFGIDVILIEPGLIKSGFSEAAVSQMTMSPGVAEVYAPFHEAVAAATKGVYTTGSLAPLAGVPEDCASTVEAAISARRPKARYVISCSGTVLLVIKGWTTDGMWDRFVAGSFPSPT